MSYLVTVFILEKPLATPLNEHHQRCRKAMC